MIFLSERIAAHLQSSDIIGRGAGTLLHGLSDHPTRKKLVSCGLTKLRDEDLRLLGVPTREERGMLSTWLVLVE